jgi:hypothetical protein
MTIKRILAALFSIFIITHSGYCQEIVNPEIRILFRGLVMDASSLSPIANSQILINRNFSSVSSNDGTFSFYVNRNDTVLFKHLGYKSTILYVSDTLRGSDFIAGIYMNSDTLSINEVVIIPKFMNLRSEIMNSASKTPSTFDNAKYNVAVSAYQGRTSQSKLNNSADNYLLLTQKQKVNAYEKGGIPSDRILGISPFLLVPAAYLLIKGFPEKPDPYKSQLTDQELKQIHAKYLETLKQRK